ncbi:hypothetical protein [Paenibacillus sinopodophylli]|nr:hypothetical protein [Paenibacillus sinopodophylli]
MTDKQKETAYKPDITNYDYVWGSDQDEYVKDQTSIDDSPQQSVDSEEEK